MAKRQAELWPRRRCPALRRRKYRLEPMGSASEGTTDHGFFRRAASTAPTSVQLRPPPWCAAAGRPAGPLPGLPARRGADRPGRGRTLPGPAAAAAAAVRRGVRARAGQRLPERFDFHARSEEHTSELQSREKLVCRLLLAKKKNSMA